jgi:hypothetical protein
MIAVQYCMYVHTKKKQTAGVEAREKRERRDIGG